MYSISTDIENCRLTAVGGEKWGTGWKKEEISQRTCMDDPWTMIWGSPEWGGGC